jgi:hypothetical protein
LNAIRLANAALRNRATCSGPLVASMPKKMMVRASRQIRTTMGSSASSRLGGRGGRRAGRGDTSALASAGVSEMSAMLPL